MKEEARLRLRVVKPDLDIRIGFLALVIRKDKVNSVRHQMCRIISLRKHSIESPIHAVESHERGKRKAMSALSLKDWLKVRFLI